MATHHSAWGAKIGPRIAYYITQAIVSTHTKLATLKHRIAMAVFHSISDEISDEVDVTFGPLFAKMNDSLADDHPAKPLVNFLHTNRGQLKAIVGTAANMSGLLGSIASIMNNELYPLVYKAVAENPHALPTVQDAVQFAAFDIMNLQDAYPVGNANGFDNGWVDFYYRLAQNVPSPADLISFIRRGQLTGDEFVTGVRRNGVPQEFVEAYRDQINVPLSPPDLALAALRGNMSMQDAMLEAYKSGVNETNFGIIVGNTGEPPGAMQLLEAYRRGFIDEATLRKGILQSRIRDEWIPTMEKLRYSPMSIADAVNAVVQNHISMQEGEAIANDNGLEPGAFQTLYETAGNPLSRTEMAELYNRGLATEDQVKQALRESRIKDKYVNLAFNLHTKLLPIFTLQRALRYGGVKHADAIRIARENGYSEEDAKIVVDAGSAERLQTYRDKVVAAVQSLYEDNAISVDYANSVTEAMGYTKNEAQFITQSSEFRKQARVINQVVNAIRSKYTNHHITKNEASGFLDAAGIPSVQRDFLLKLWTIEHSAFVKTLTEAQTVKAVKDEILTPEQGVTRLVNMGYSEGDAAILVEMG